MKRNIIKNFAGLIMLLLTAGCVTRKYDRPELLTDRLFRKETTDTTSLANLPWRTLFTDTILQNLITRGLNRNLDLRIAMQRMAAAGAAVDQSKAAYLPSLSAGLTVQRSKASGAALNLPPGLGIDLGTTTYQAQLSASWEADLWGKLSSAKKAALADLLRSEASKNAIQTQLISAIAGSYYSLLALDKQLQITQQTISSRVKEVETMKELKEGNIVNGAAVVQSEANRYAAEVSVPDIRQQIRQYENALSILLADPPGTITRGTLETQSIDSSLHTGLPAQLLANRPDVQAAEYAYRSSFENTNLARTYFYPSLTITAQGGLSTLKVTDFFNGAVFYNLIGGLTQPIFSKGVNRARLKIAQATQEETRLRYQQSLLNAGQEVADYLFAYEAATTKAVIRKEQVQSLGLSVSYTRELLRYSSSTNYTDVLTSEQSLLAAQLSGVNDRLQQLQAVVGLYRALGGGTK